MLVLSRNPNEKILFPEVGISVEIIKIKGRSVRVGIEAPKNIRVLRDELEDVSKGEFNGEPIEISRSIQLTNETDLHLFSESQRSLLQKRIDEIALAIALAQNQQRQGLTDNVDVALEQAFKRIRILKKSLESKCASSQVCEPKIGYQVQRNGASESTYESILELLPENQACDFRFEFDLAFDVA